MAEPKLVFQVCLVGLALAGLGGCLYFAMAVRRARTFMCRNGSCVSLTETPYASVFRVQNWQLGIPFYLLVGAAALTWNPFLVWPSVAVSVVAALVSVFLTFALTFRLKVVCIVCYIAQAVNLAIFGLWLWSLW